MYESVFLTLMRERDWPIDDVEKTKELTVTSKLGESPVKLEGFGPGLWAAGSPDEGAWHCFVTITIGEPKNEPTRWAVLTLDDVVAQVVGGDDWAIVGAGLLISTQIGLQESQNVYALAAR